MVKISRLPVYFWAIVINLLILPKRIICMNPNNYVYMAKIR